MTSLASISFLYDFTFTYHGINQTIFKTPPPATTLHSVVGGFIFYYASKVKLNQQWQE